MSVLERKPDVVERFQDTDTDDYIEKCNTYEAEYARRLKAKYFSKKNLYGGSIFDKDVTIDNETIRSSR
uniref:Uncharacterized protein n=1 Tax=Nelumbo nucifera TaxID=4432 RepID=A0A822YLW1_NELNU|nr:TPA_asm: hypothetical protein HUJ06_005794 [Nelumbo nucifera]